MPTIKVIDSLNGDILPKTNQEIAKGGNIAFTFAPKFGYRVDSVFVDNEKVIDGYAESYMFTNVQEDHSIYIRYTDAKCDSVAFNRYNNIRNIGYLIVQYLMKNNDDLWRLLKYNTPDALQRDYLTVAEKRELIFDGKDDPDSEQYRVFRSAFTDDAITAQIAQLRVYLATINPENRSIGTIDVAIECVCHVKIQDLNSYENRLEVMVQQALQTLNGADVGGIGELVFDDNSSFFDLASLNMFNNRNFLGFTTIMSCKVSNMRTPENYGGMFSE